MSLLTITVGISGSGKSTWARQQRNVVVVCRDDIRLAHGLKHGEDEDFVTKVHRSQIEAAVLDGHDVIVADTNIQPKFRRQLIKFAHQLGADVEIKTFHIDINTAILRDANRAASVGATVISRQFQQLQSQNVEDELLPVLSFEKYEHSGKPKAVIFDIDGTLARHVNRSPYDYSKVYDDEPIEDVVTMLRTLLGVDAKVIFVSGREDVCRSDTLAWLDKHAGVTVDNLLYMRKKGDMRPDWIIKNEIYDMEIIPHFDIVMVFDDRDQVVTHLRRRGITVAQVAPGRF